MPRGTVTCRSCQITAIALVSLGVLVGVSPLHSPETVASPTETGSAAPTVYLGGGLSDEQLIVFSTAVAAGSASSVVLLDSQSARPYIKHFLNALQPARVVPIGTFAEKLEDLVPRKNVKLEPALPWTRGPPIDLWRSLFPASTRLVVCPSSPRDTLLQAAGLAGVLRAPLYVMHDTSRVSPEVGVWLHHSRTSEIFAICDTVKPCRQLANIRVVELTNTQAVAEAHRTLLCEQGPIQTLVVTNPTHRANATSALAPWMALERRAALVFTNDGGDDATTAIQNAIADPRLASVENLILAGSPREIATESRPNPISGKDAFVESEPMTPQAATAFTFATGRLFHRDLAVVPLMMARQRFLGNESGERRALIVSNAGGGLPLLELLSRHTARELRNNGYETRSLFRGDALPKDLQLLASNSHVFIWEGHHATLIDQFGMAHWDEPMPTSLVVLQSCLALNEEETTGLLQRGAVGLVGSSTRTYSASGGAFTLAFFNGMLYDRLSVGASLRQAKNFLLCYSMLKEQRLGEKSDMSGANVRSSWAFTLWGDPTLRLPPPALPRTRLGPLETSVHNNMITLKVPPQGYEPVTVDCYTAEMVPNSRLAGLVIRDSDDAKRLVPLLFAEVSLPNARSGTVPRLHGSVPARNLVTVWDSRRRSLYLLTIPRAKDSRELQFQIEWLEATSSGSK